MDLRLNRKGNSRTTRRDGNSVKLGKTPSISVSINGIRLEKKRKRNVQLPTPPQKKNKRRNKLKQIETQRPQNGEIAKIAAKKKKTSEGNRGRREERNEVIDEEEVDERERK